MGRAFVTSVPFDRVARRRKRKGECEGCHSNRTQWIRMQVDDTYTGR
ncbi:hypothetical protein T261_3091 [Streptomyces lydicus]|nr:hypothetical protein T261_3091 [Streptomyces lydicus]